MKKVYMGGRMFRDEEQKENYYAIVEDGKVISFGPSREFEPFSDGEIIDMSGYSYSISSGIISSVMKIIS